MGCDGGYESGTAMMSLRKYTVLMRRQLAKANGGIRLIPAMVRDGASYPDRGEYSPRKTQRGEGTRTAQGRYGKPSQIGIGRSGGGKRYNRR